MDYRIGQGYDVHQLREGLPMWLGGVRIESNIGFVAHSDGDVAIHALCDALLGALALGDIGHLFPDTSDEWKGISSTTLLQKVMERVSALGWRGRIPKRRLFAPTLGLTGHRVHSERGESQNDLEQ